MRQTRLYLLSLFNFEGSILYLGIVSILSVGKKPDLIIVMSKSVNHDSHYLARS